MELASLSFGLAATTAGYRYVGVLDEKPLLLVAFRHHALPVGGIRVPTHCLSEP